MVYLNCLQSYLKVSTEVQKFSLCIKLGIYISDLSLHTDKRELGNWRKSRDSQVFSRGPFAKKSPWPLDYALLENERMPLIILTILSEALSPSLSLFANRVFSFLEDSGGNYLQTLEVTRLFSNLLSLLSAIALTLNKNLGNQSSPLILLVVHRSNFTKIRSSNSKMIECPTFLS